MSNRDLHILPEQFFISQSFQDVWELCRRGTGGKLTNENRHRGSFCCQSKHSLVSTLDLRISNRSKTILTSKKVSALFYCYYIK